MKFVLVMAVFFVVSGCGSSTENPYPYYHEQDLNSICKEESEVFSDMSEIDTGPYKKVFVMPTRFRSFVAGFVDEFVSGLEDKGWKVMDSDTQAKTDNIAADIFAATGVLNPEIVAFYMIDFEGSTHLLERWRKLSEQKFVKVFIAEDLNNETNLDAAKQFAQWGDAVFARYPEAFTKTIAPNRVLCFPFYHGAGRHYFEAARFDEEKKPQLLLSGAVDQTFYPLRYAALKVSKSKPGLVIQRQHPGYKTGEINPVQEAKNYAADLASYKIAVTGAVMGPKLPMAPSLVAKHFEIAATGTVLITDAFVAPLMAKIGFIENIHYLVATPESLEATLYYWLKPENAARLNQISKAGHDLVKSRHSLEHRVEQFDSTSIKVHLLKQKAPPP